MARTSARIAVNVGSLWPSSPHESLDGAMGRLGARPDFPALPSAHQQNFFSADYSSFLLDGGVLDSHAAHQQQFSDRPAGLSLTCMAQGSSTSLAHPANGSPSAHITGRPVSCIPHTQVQSQQPCCTSKGPSRRASATAGGPNAYLPDQRPRHTSSSDQPETRHRGWLHARWG